MRNTPPVFCASAIGEIPNRTSSATTAPMPRTQRVIELPPCPSGFRSAAGIADSARQGKHGFGGMQHPPTAGVGLADLPATATRSSPMYLARFSYDVLPVNRQRALDFIRREVEAARGNGLNARLLVPLTRGHGDGAALQFEVELQKLDQFRNRGIGSSKETGNWMHAFSEVLTAPPAVVILHVDSAEAK